MCIQISVHINRTVNAWVYTSRHKSRSAGYLGIGQFNRLNSHRGIPVGMHRVRSSALKSGDTYGVLSYIYHVCGGG